MFFLIEQLFAGENAKIKATIVHNAYVDGGADSWQNPHNRQFFSLSRIEKLENHQVIVHLSRNGQLFSTEPMSEDKLMNILCGGKFQSQCKTQTFNTKEAHFQTRLENTLQLLKEYDIEHNPEKICEKITNITLKDNSKGILSTYWIRSLENTHGFTDVELMHMLWCMYINWDNSASVLSDPLPLRDESLIQKDRDVLNQSQELLELAPRVPSAPHTDIEIDIKNVLSDLQLKFIKSHLFFLSPQDIKNMSDYFISRYKKADNPFIEVDIDSINQVKAQFEKRISDTASETILSAPRF